MTRRFQKIIKTAEINNKEIHESDLLILKQTLFPNGSDIKKYIFTPVKKELKKLQNVQQNPLELQLK